MNETQKATPPTLHEFLNGDEMASYRAMLRTFDWWFEFCDDSHYVNKTRIKLTEMRRQQAILDPYGTIWTIIAPYGHGIPLPIVCAKVKHNESDTKQMHDETAKVVYQTMHFASSEILESLKTRLDLMTSERDKLARKIEQLEFLRTKLPEIK